MLARTLLALLPVPVITEDCLVIADNLGEADACQAEQNKQDAVVHGLTRSERKAFL